MKNIIIVSIMIVADVFAATAIYDVELSYNDNFMATQAKQEFLATADSISEVTFFCGRKIIPGKYNFWIADANGFQISPTIFSDSAGLFDYELVSAQFNPKVPVRKGFTYQVHIKHSLPQCSTNFYYNRDNPYSEGELIGHSGWDLAARIKGFNNFPKDLFGMNTCLTITHRTKPDTFPQVGRRKWEACIDSMKAMGITWDRIGFFTWQHFQFDSTDIDTFHYRWCDSLMTRYALDSINVFWCFNMSTKWATSETLDVMPDNDTIYYNDTTYVGHEGWYEGFPINLFEPVLVDGQINTNNYFAQYVDKFVRKYGPDGDFWDENPGLPYLPIRYYEMWNEPEYLNCKGKWDTLLIMNDVYDSLIKELGKDESFMKVYSRLCIVGDSAAKFACDNVQTLVYVPHHHWCQSEWPATSYWLQKLSENGVHNFCDGMTFHSYAIREWEPLFHNRQKLTLDSIWIYIRNEGHFSNKFLWCTEHSTGCYVVGPDSNTVAYPVQTDEQLATICTFYANDSPKGPLTHSFLWCFSHLYLPDNRFFWLTRDSLDYCPPGYGYRQLTTFFKNCRFNQSLISGSAYDTIRVYEFENSQTHRRMYVGWKEWEIGGDPVDYELPLRTNAGKVDSVAQNSNPGENLISCNSLGYASVSLDTAPIFISEPSDSVFRRPDLVIDSVWTVPTYPRDGDSVLAYAMLRNIDAVKATPDTIFVKFYNNDTLFATDTITDEIKPESTLVSSSDDTVIAGQGLHLGKAVANATRKFVEHNFSNNARYRQYDIPLRPYGSIKINHDSTYSNFPYVVLNLSSTNPNDTLNPPADSMKLWQYYGDSLNNIDSTGWTVYDSTYFWYLLQEEATNTIYVQYKVGKENDSYEYSDSIVFDKTLPTGSFVINDDSTFANNSDVTLENSINDTQSGMSKMRFGHKYLKNIVKNSGFDTTTHWQTDTALYHDSLELYEIPLQTIGNYFYQAIAPESLADFVNDTLLLWIDLVSDSFVGDARVAFQYIYGADTAIRGTHPYGDSITIPEGTNATVSHYNLYSYFKYYPDPPAGEEFIEARVGVFADSASRNSGSLFIDNLRLDAVSPADDYTRFENHDSLKEWSLITGNGVRKVWGQFADCAGNETAVSFDSIIVDTTKPARRISYPQNGQTINGTITITGWAHDSLDDPPHFKQYELQHQAQMSAIWYGNDPDSISYTPKYPIQVGQGQKPVEIGDWNTNQVNDGWYNLKLTVSDSASNSRDTTISVNVNNDDTGEGEFSGFSNYIYGLAAGNEVYIGEFSTGKIYQYNTNYELIDTFKLVDSLGTGFPLAMAIDDSGKLWVANTNSHLISKFTSQGSLLLRFAGGFSLPSGFAFDNSGNIWVSDRLHHKIKKFNQDGDSLFAFGTQGSEPGEIDRPIGIAFFDNRIYIADSKNKRVSVFDTLGDFIEVIADSAGIQMPFGLVIDSSGCLFVSDFFGNQVIEFDPYENQLYKIDSILDSPTALALSPDANILYVSDTRNKRVLAFQVRGEPPDSGGGPQAYGDSYFDRLMFDVYPSLSAKQMNIRLQGFAGRKISLKVYDVTGRLIKTFYDNQMIKANQNISWNCKDNIKRKLANGVYFIRLETEDYKETKKVILLE